MWISGFSCPLQTLQNRQSLPSSANPQLGQQFGASQQQQQQQAAPGSSAQHVQSVQMLWGREPAPPPVAASPFMAVQAFPVPQPPLTATSSMPLPALSGDAAMSVDTAAAAIAAGDRPAAAAAAAAGINLAVLESMAHFDFLTALGDDMAGMSMAGSAPNGVCCVCACV